MEEETAEETAPTESYCFGPEGHKVSDVTLLVQGAELHVNKMFLATRSRVFYALFFGDFKEKDQDRVVIEADLRAFCHLMEILYYGKIETKHTYFIYCLKSCPKDNLCENASIQQKLWLRTVTLMELADRFDVYNLVFNSMQDLFLKARCPGMKGCFNEGVRQLLALVYDMKEWKAVREATEKAMSGALRNLKPINPQFSIGFEELKWLFTISPTPCSKFISADIEVVDGPEVFNLGDRTLSDVTLVVGDRAEFKIHRMTLASRSDYFKSLFYPTEAKNNKKLKSKQLDPIKIDGDVDSVWEVLHFMYTGRLGNRDGRYTVCWNPDAYFCSNQKQVQGYWERVVTLLELAKRFLLMTLDDLFCSAKCPKIGRKCQIEGVGHLLAANYGLKGYKKRRHASYSAFAGALKNMDSMKPQMSFDFTGFNWLVNRDASDCSEGLVPPPLETARSVSPQRR